MRISEIFTSLQGEGTLMGTPTTFIRLVGCNLRCNWCDTTFSHTGGREMSVREILEKVEASHVVITGGEPLTYPPEELQKLVEGLQDRHVTVETNATIPSDLNVSLWSLSPKLGSSGNTPDTAVISSFLEQAPGRVQLKFVISDEEDLQAVPKLLSQLPVKETPIILQPEGSAEPYLERMRILSERILADSAWKPYRVRLLPQLHRLLWPHERER